MAPLLPRPGGRRHGCRFKALTKQPWMLPSFDGTFSHERGHAVSRGLTVIAKWFPRVTSEDKWIRDIPVEQGRLSHWESRVGRLG